jgi:transcription-repair coupling factor (superfamily II helicase)
MVSTPRCAKAGPKPLRRDEHILLTHGPLAEGFVTTDSQFAVITETELYAIPPKTRRAREARATQIDNLLRDLSELKPGDPVVHAQYGVGQYLGLVNMDLGDGDTEFLHLEYAKGRQTLRAGGQPAPDFALQRRWRRRGAVT